jgi:hypothetical protein
VEHRVGLGKRVIASVIAERSFLSQRFPRIDITFDNKVGIGGDFEVAGFAFDELDRFFP